MTSLAGRALRPALSHLLERVHIGSIRYCWEDGTSTLFGTTDPVTVVRWSDRATWRTLREGTLGFCGSYVDCDYELIEGDLLDFMTSLVSAKLNQPIKKVASMATRARATIGEAMARFWNVESVRSHYDLDEAFYALWLDESLTYTCGFESAPGQSLEAMQRAKIDLALTRLNLRQGQSLLDLGCGWGSLALHAADRFASNVTAVSLSEPQIQRLRREASVRGLSHRIEPRVCDFGEAKGTFDRITAIGLAEHVGRRGLPRLFRTIHDRLADDGIALVHTIGSSDFGGTDPWLERNVFPGTYVPTLSELCRASERSGLRVCQVEDLGPHYAVTLTHWYRRFLAVRDDVVRERGERFARIWEMYLTMLVPSFRHLSTCLFQMVLTKGEGCRPELSFVTSGGYPRAPSAPRRAIVEPMKSPSRSSS